MSQSLARALQLLDLLGEGGRSLDELAQSVGVHKTTVLRLLRTMEDDRFVRRDDNHRYFLGSRLFELGTSALEQRTIRDIALPHLESLGRDTGGQAVHLAAYESGRAIYIAKVESTSSVRMYSRVGLVAPLHATAVGKLLTCELPERQLANALDANDFQPFTKRTITTPDAYRAELAKVRAQGWSEDSAEHEDFINCVAAPIRDGVGRIIAAASVSVPDVILTRDEVHDLLPALQQTTAAIAADWASTTERT